ncbi:tetraspanin-1-like [Plodia interpunctella]|uniref:tetraspanin-1-like n=1 Tax=Plodia interpunctella TaxID=58824 RepID=UPI002368AA71|nr:tetraspanin-1-like [Plodia interpunctella]
MLYDPKYRKLYILAFINISYVYEIMGMSRCYSLMKCLLILFNIIFLCVGGGACAFAAWALWDGRASENAEGRAGLCALLAWGAVLLLGALAALAGCARGSASLLAAAFALLALSAVAEAAAAWWGAAHLPQLRHALLQRLDHTVRVDYGVLPARTSVIDSIQQGLECCGAEGPRDWQDSAWSRAQAEPEEGAPAAEARSDTLDLSVSAPTAYYWVPASCCNVELSAEECEASRRVPAASGGGAGLRSAGCGRGVVAALARAARLPLAAAAALLAAHALALLLALALCLRAHPDHRYKA